MTVFSPGQAARMRLMITTVRALAPAMQLRY